MSSNIWRAVESEEDSNPTRYNYIWNVNWPVTSSARNRGTNTRGGNTCNKYKNVFVPGTLGSLPDTYLVPVHYILGVGVWHIDAIWIYQWGLSTVQRGTTGLTLIQHLFT